MYNGIIVYGPQCLERFCRSSWRNELASSRSVATCARKMAFSFSKKLALIAISSSRAFRASRDFFAAWLFRFLRSKYLPSLDSSGIGFFSLRGRFWPLCREEMACAMAGEEAATRGKENYKSTTQENYYFIYMRQERQFSAAPSFAYKNGLDQLHSCSSTALELQGVQLRVYFPLGAVE